MRIPDSPQFPLSLSLNSIKDLSLTIRYPSEAILYFAGAKARNVKELQLIQIKDGRPPKVRIVFNPSRGYKKLLRAINKMLQRRTEFPT